MSSLGDEKERLCRYLRRMPLPHDVRDRLRTAVPLAVNDPRRLERERKAWRRLAAVLNDA